MRTKVVTVATRPDPGLDQLVFSMKKQGIDYNILGMGTQWKGFGTKVILLQQYLETIKDEYTHVLFVDAYDVAFLGNMDEIESIYNNCWPGSIVFSAELNCWPDSSLKDQYPECHYNWKYLNSGSYMAPIESLLELINTYPPEFRMDDQLYFTRTYLDAFIEATFLPVVLDTGCRLFQTIAFCFSDEFSYSDTRLFNNHTDSVPVIIHGNGRTPMDKVYDLLKYEHASS